MMNPTSGRKLAVLIDADNVSASKCAVLVNEIAKYGLASVKQAYGDWTTPQLASWKDVLHEYAITPVQQFGYSKGKNSTDSAMIIDAMDLLYTGKFDGFCLVTSDCDFTPLATRIRKSGLAVYGFGEKKSVEAFQNACDVFVFLEALADPAQEKAGKSTSRSTASKRRSKKELNSDTRLINLLRGAVDTAADDDGWANIAEVGVHIRNQSSFDPRNYGYSKLSDLVAETELFEMDKRDQRENGSYNLYLRDKRAK